jgi:hypothetical protein
MNASDDRARLLKLAAGLRTLTADGKIQWSPTDDEEGFLYPTTKGSIVIASRERQFAQAYTLEVLDQSGRVIDRIESDPEDFTPQDVQSALARLHDEARRNALKVDELVNGLFDELGIDREG